MQLFKEVAASTKELKEAEAKKQQKKTLKLRIPLAQSNQIHCIFPISKGRF